jgi:hypothetical protein
MKFILGSDSLTAFVQGKPYTVNKSAEIYKSALQAVRSDDEEAFLRAVDMKTTIANIFSDFGDVQVQGKRIMYGNREITGLVARRVFELMENGLDAKPMLNFISNLMANPSKRAVDETFGFVDACSLPITEDGCILAYKFINNDYTDWYSSSVFNKPAELYSEGEFFNLPIEGAGKHKEVVVDYDDFNGNIVVSMDRNLVDEDKNRTCSVGLHFCSVEYAKSFRTDRIIVVKVNPADIVAIPSDHRESKARCCRYEIIQELDKSPQSNGSPVKEINQEFASEVDKQAQYMKLRNEAILIALGYQSVTEVAAEFNLSRRQVARIRDKSQAE